MTPRQVLLVKRSFAAVARQEDRLAGGFFAQLFARDAALWKRFRAGITMREGDLFEGLAAIVASIDRLHPIVPVLEWVALQGARRGIGERQYQAIEESLVAALEALLAGAFTIEHRIAWTAACRTVARIMARSLESEAIAA